MFQQVFIEKFLAEGLGLQHDQFTEADTTAAVISTHDATRLMYYLRNMDITHGIKDEHKTAICESIIEGVGVLVSTWNTSDSFLDDMTPGWFKEHPFYSHIISLNNKDRINKTMFIQELKNLYGNSSSVGPTAPDAPVAESEIKSEQAVNAAPAPQATPLPPTAEEIQIEKEKNLLSKIKRLIVDRIGYDYVTVEHNNRQYIVSKSRQEMCDKDIHKLMDVSGKSVAFLSHNIYEYIKRYLSTDLQDIQKNILCVLPGPSYGSLPFSASPMPIQDGSRISCLGHIMTKVNIPHIDGSNGNKSMYASMDRVFNDTQTNVVYAVLMSGALCLMCQPGDFKKVEFVSTCIDDIVERWDRKKSMKELAAKHKAMNDTITRQNLDDYIKFCSENSNQYITQIKKALSDAEKEVGELQTKLFEALKMHRQYTGIIMNYDEAKHLEEEKKKNVEAFEAVRALPQIRSIFVQDNKVHIYTNEFNVEDPRTNKIHNLGNFYINLNMMSSSYNANESISIKNMKHTVKAWSGSGTMEAPHIFNGGKMCHGNLINSIKEHYADRDLYAVVMDLIIFLESVNVNDPAGACIDKWPEYVPAVKADDDDEEFISILKGTKR